ncbi:hypothetical protein HQ560_04780 [bacterium]|nr:hypothetical protein [bacterium]
MSRQAVGDHLDTLRALVTDFGAHRRRWRRLVGASRFLLLGPGLLLLWIALDAWVGLGAWPLLIAFALIIVSAVTSLCRDVAPSLGASLEAHREALVIEDLHGELDNCLIGALQLGEGALGSDAERRGHAPLLIEALLQRTAERLRPVNLKRLLDLAIPRRFAAAGAVVLAIWLGLGVGARPVLAERCANLHNAWAVLLDTLFPVTLTVSPGDTAIVRGSALALAVDIDGARRPQATLTLIDDETGKETQHTLDLHAEVVDGQAVDRARRRLTDMQKPLQYYFSYGAQQSPTYRVDVGDRPAIQAISYELVYPAYTGQPPRTLTGLVPKLQALPGTSVLVSFAATTDLHPDLCRVEWQDGSRQELTIQGRFGHFSFTMDQADQASVFLCGVHGAGFEMKKPLSLALGLERDQPPSISIRVRKKELILLAEEAAAFALPFVAEDDFGLTEVKLSYRITALDEMMGRGPRQGELVRRVEPAPDRLKGTFEAMFESLAPPLVPGDKVVLELTAKDNNSETGPGLGRSRKLSFVVVRPDLGAFTEKEFGFAQRASVLGGLQKSKRVTDLLVEAERTVRTEKPLPVEKKDVKARVRSEGWPSGSEDRVGDYFKLLSGSR